MLDNRFARNLLDRFLFREHHPRALSTRHNNRGYTHPITANKAIIQTILDSSFVAPKTSPVTPLKCLCEIPTITRPAITATSTATAPANHNKGTATPKEMTKAATKRALPFPPCMAAKKEEFIP